MNIELTGAQKKELRGIAQRLDAKVSIGKNGLSEKVLHEIEVALSTKELLKVRFCVGRDELKTMCASIESKTASICIGSVGKTASFFRPKADEKEAKKDDSKQ